MGMRKCSQCGNTGHNSRTCRSLSTVTENCQSMKLFGVELVKLPSHNFEFTNNSLGFRSSTELSSEDSNKFIKNGCFSNGLSATTTQPQRKKGIPWSEEEHRLFLMGLEKLGKGNWRGIAKKYVTTRTSTQVASHAQKYFLRQNKLSAPTHLSMVERKSISVGMFSPYNPSSPQLPYNCRLFNNSMPNLELSLAAPPPPPPLLRPAWNRRSVVQYCKRPYMV